MTLRTFNNILSFVILALVAWVLLSPFIANVTLWWEKQTDRNHGYVYKSDTVSGDANKQLKDIPKDNRLVIPSIQFDAGIFEGSTPKVLNEGPWRRPGTSDPTRGGNTVIAAHRLNFGGVANFYNLDKIKKDDSLIVYWQGKEYDYKVDQIDTVSPLNIDVEKNTSDPILTLYTCTPLWSSSERLVVKGSLIQEGKR